MIDVARSVSIAGNATLMTDSSMLAMLDARIVAISTQGLALAGPDTSADVDWIIASSQGLVLRDDIVAGVPPRSPGKTVIHHRRRAHTFTALLRTVFLKDNDAQPIVLPREGAPFSLRALRRGIDTRTLQAYLGHRSINSTTRYAALAPGRFKNIWGKA
jgi:hypothetical protein